MPDFDVVVVGGGLAGLSTAASCAKVGLSVVVCEQGGAVGGIAHSFERNGRIFDSAIRVLGEAPFVESFTNWLGVSDAYELMPLDTIYGSSFPDGSLNVAPTGHERFLAEHTNLSKSDAAGLKAFFELRKTMFEESARSPMHITDASELAQAAEALPTLFKYRSATVVDVLADFIEDEHLRAIVSASWPYMGLPPHELSFFAFSQFLGILIDGSFYCKGSFQKLVEALELAVTTLGGTVLTKSPVTEILTENGRAAGVRIAHNDVITARTVVAAGSAPETFRDLLSSNVVPERFLRRINKLTLSESAFVVYAAVPKGIVPEGIPHEVFIYDHWDHRQTWDDERAGRPAGISMSVLTHLDPDLTDKDEDLLIVTSVAPYDRPDGRSWTDVKESYGMEVLARCERIVPDLRANLSFFEAGTPTTIERFTGNLRGATYGWALTPRQVGGKRLHHDSPVPELYLAGHWTEEGPSSFRAILSGINAARHVAANVLGSDEIPDFKPAERR